MKSKLWRSLAGGVALMVGVTSVASAQSGLPETGWYTTAIIQNLSDTAQAEVVLSAYNATSTSSPALSQTAGIKAGANVVFRPDQSGVSADGNRVGIPNLGNSFFGSMVISSLEPLAAVAKVTNVPLESLGVTGGAANAEYTGSSTGATTLIYPNVKNKFNGFTSIFYVQSVGADGTITATVKTAAPDSKTYTKSFPITANRTVAIQVGQLTNGTTTWDSAAGTGCSGAASSATGSICFGALTVSSTTPVVGTSVQYQNGVSPVKQANASALFTTEEAASTVYCPLYKSRFPTNAAGSNFSGIQVQNVTNAPINITVRLRGNSLPASNPAKGLSYTVPFTDVAPGESRVVSRFIGAGGFPDAGVGSAVVEATGNVIAASTEDSGAAAQGTSTIYNCFSAAKGSTKIAFPSAKRDFPSATNAGANNTGVNIQNISTTPTSITAKYVCRTTAASLQPVNIPFSLAAGESVSFFQGNAQSNNLIPNNALCAVTVTSTGSAQIVGLANESVEGFTAGLASGAVKFRDSNNYEGFNQ